MNFWKSRKALFISISLGLAVCLSCQYLYYATNNDIKTIWGENYKCEKIIKTVINSKVMQRLKKVDQSGPARYFGPKLPAFSRYDHSIGVIALLKMAGASIKEQVAGALHDASHTVFSHVSDFIFAQHVQQYVLEGYQEKIHLDVLKRSTKNLARKIGFKVSDFDVTSEVYPALEQSFPDICADRIQYNIHTGVILNRITKNDAKDIIEHLKFKNGVWFFTNKDAARKFSELPLSFTKEFWGAKWNICMNIHLAHALKRAIDLKIITMDELFSTDVVVLDRLTKNQDRFIQLNLQQCRKPLERIPGKNYTTEHYNPKFRGVNPMVLCDNGEMKRLTEIDAEFKEKYDLVKKWCEEGYQLDILVES